MQLLRLGKLGSFDFNSRFYADDDLIVGAADPFQLFRILFEVIRGGGLNNPDVAFMLDQCHNIEDKIPGQIRSVLNVQEMTARALLVDRDVAVAAQSASDVLGANDIFMDAFYTDVRPALADWREGRGLPRDPMSGVRHFGVPAEDRKRTRRWLAGRVGRLTDEFDSSELVARCNRLGAGPQEHELRRWQHLGQGHRYRPGHQRARRADVGQGIGRRPRHAHRVGPRRSAPRPAARSSTSTRVSIAKTRWSRLSTSACTATAELRPRSTRRCTARRCRSRRSSAPGCRNRDRDGGRRRAADGEIFGGKVVWVPWRRPGFQLGLDIAAIRPPTPTRSAASSAATGSPRGASTTDEAEANSLWIIETARTTSTRTARPTRSAGSAPGSRRCPRRIAESRPAALAPTIRGLASTDKPMVGPLHRRPAGL